MKIAVLTSSRADFGIYLPLLKAFEGDDDFDLEIIAFGTHLSTFHGYTLDDIIKNGFSNIHKLVSLLINDDPVGISTSYGLTATKFADFWGGIGSKYDLVFCLGDRFEMAAAVIAGIPFGIRFAHLHGGDTTLGAIDNIYRHQITLASQLHFVALDEHAQKVKSLIDSADNVYVIGALSLDNTLQMDLLSQKLFYNKWNIRFDKPSILVTVHPETVALSKNVEYARIVYDTLRELADDFQIIITMPNADTAGNIYRKQFEELKQQNEGFIKIVENFGTQSYFSCMKYSDILLGNTSSGILEAASFDKYVVNLGDRQLGRQAGPNVIHCPFDKKNILNVVKKFIGKRYKGENLYYKGGATNRIIEILKK
ncbi:MAG: GDP/UDP-N,N'-diacetylbacillosamine 2-epimerase (hydrolyzing) [Parvicella sp.]|jgi:GDP/UDP-N,N'-diacetylbacillosamine 2-epimerase (hydrolysing)